METEPAHETGKSSSSLLGRLRAHFESDPMQLTVVEQKFELYERANLHLAIEELSGQLEGDVNLIGIVVPEEFHVVSLSKLSHENTAMYFSEGPVEYVQVTVANEVHLSCVKRGLYFFHDSGDALAMLLHDQEFMPRSGVVAEVMAGSREIAERFAGKLSKATRFGKAFRGNILSLQTGCFGDATVHFHRLPRISRDDIILPEAVLKRVERHTIDFSRYAETLRASGRHLKRGVLLYGPPGTGKTLTAMYLASQMRDRTVLLLTGGAMGSIGQACGLARLLEPATVVLEDVDLIGTERNRQAREANALLFELLNQMDGLAEDFDILFVLTTNRPDILEPALAARPGRIDQAIAIPLPDLDCRRRLFELYGKGLHLRVSDLDRFIKRTEGVSGACIRELLRKASLLAAEDGGQGKLTITDRHLEEALTELLIVGGELTQSLLGARAVRTKARPKAARTSRTRKRKSVKGG